jgi:hypothetical protein
MLKQIEGSRCAVAVPLLAAGALGGGVLLSVAWVAFKVGALSYGGGFVIIALSGVPVGLPSGLDPAAGDAGRDDADEQLPLPGGPGLDARPFGRFLFVL